MIKVLDKDVKKAIGGLEASEIVSLLKRLQDASGIKICTAVTKTDPAYREV